MQSMVSVTPLQGHIHLECQRSYRTGVQFVGLLFINQYCARKFFMEKSDKYSSYLFLEKGKASYQKDCPK